MNKVIVIILGVASLLSGCRNRGTESDASGTFEATEVIVSAEANGKLLALNIEEGQALKRGEQIGMIDSTALYLTKLQLMQNQKAILAGRQDVKTQLESLRKELTNAMADQKRIENLVKGQVASQKQLDDANLRIDVLKAKIDAQENLLNTGNTALTEQSRTIAAQLNVIEDQLRRCRIINPVEGTVLTKYSESYEMTGVGKPLYKVADLSQMILRAYISNDQQSSVKIGQKVSVLVDDGDKSMRTYEGVVQWINDKAEFTPKTIQTKEERANLVYAVKIAVKNDGLVKIGMYGEVKF
ncbi:MAG TPA: HlyD family efflux transporter periplasmic adaptor subunit [Leptospiraceae bacterium]|nr:HlyD family efflux transporter periplasmic adaptor subunit [Leptospiraceae bacterium]